MNDNETRKAVLVSIRGWAGVNGIQQEIYFLLDIVTLLPPSSQEIVKILINQTFGALSGTLGKDVPVIGIIFSIAYLHQRFYAHEIDKSKTTAVDDKMFNTSSWPFMCTLKLEKKIYGNVPPPPNSPIRRQIVVTSDLEESVDVTSNDQLEGAKLE